MDKIYVDLYPSTNSSQFANLSLPTILVLQGVEVDKSEYSALANELAREGFRVIVPNFVARSGDYVCPDNSSVTQFLASEQSQEAQELFSNEFVLLGHSAGGYAAFGALMTESPKLDRWPTAIVTYGATAPFFDSVQRQLPPALMIAGMADTIVPIQTTREGFQDIPSSQKALISLSRFHHYSITNSGVPQYAPEEMDLRVPYGNDAAAMLTKIISAYLLNVLDKKSGWEDDLRRELASEIDNIELA